jgi:soluble lytic murein transglycosylase-like protein
MSASAAIAACILVVSSHYGVPKERLEDTLRQEPTSPAIGAAHIPKGWIPILDHYGFHKKAIAQDPCESVAAAGWIIKYVTDLKEAQDKARRDILPKAAAVWQPTIKTYAQAAGVDPSLVNAVILQESGFKPTATSSAGAFGLMQLTDKTAKTLGVNRYDVQQNLWGGIWYLATLLKIYNGNTAMALAAYNAGQAAVARHNGIPPYRETMAYVPSVLSRYARLLRVADAGPVAANIVSNE